ncbi:MAG: HNH endonuclease [Bacteroidota bacterium]|jgi:5-methylcytosine-specific restriction protein A
MFQAIYSFDHHKAYASQIARLFGFTGKVPHGRLNLQIGRLAKRIAKKHDIQLSQRKNLTYRYWDLFFDGWEEGRFWVWQLKPALVQAIKAASLSGEVAIPEELPTEHFSQLSEGIKRTVTVNSYERNPQAREICVNQWGLKCSVSDFDFEERYAQLGRGFIHVHHLVPISKIGKSYQVDPVNDLRPVCPNCHAMIHRGSDAFTIEELKEIIYYNKDAIKTAANKRKHDAPTFDKD